MLFRAYATTSNKHPDHKEGTHSHNLYRQHGHTWVNLAVTNPSLYAPSAGDLPARKLVSTSSDQPVRALWACVSILPGFYGIQLVPVPEKQHTDALHLYLLTDTCTKQKGAS